ncbi:MAG: membrane protein insertase YidC [Armatimonadetes bacterium]|nr:membrane protein insertase YidC [Armatimonadota bacterium]
MSQPQNPRSQLMTMLLLFVTLYMGWQVFSPKKSTDSRTSEQILAEIRTANDERRDVDATTLYSAYTQKLGEERGSKKLSQEEFDKLEQAANVLVAQTKFRAAMAFASDPGKNALVHKKLNDGHMMLYMRFERLHDTALWNKEQVDVTTDGADGKPVKTKVTTDELYNKFVSELSHRNKSELVWGLFPGYYLIDFLVKLTGANAGFSYWFAALLLAAVVRIAILPWTRKQFRFGKQMMQIQPMVNELKEKYKDKKGHVPQDKQAQLSAETMALYKEYGLNPFAGCGSALVQLPFFYAVFQCMQLYKFEFVKGSFLWIHPGATEALGLKLAPNLGQNDHLLIIVYGISMIVSQLLTPVSDPTQVRTQRIMGIVMSVMVTFFMFGYGLPSAFTLYWVFANVLATAQALYVYKVVAMPPLQKVQTVKGGVPAKTGFMDKFMTLMEEQSRAAAKGGAGGPKPESNGKSDIHADPNYFGKTGSPRKRKKP